LVAIPAADAAGKAVSALVNTTLADPDHRGHKRSSAELHENPFSKETDHGDL
jgi:hypothetical protein